MAYVVGFTGTTKGMTEAQEIEFIRELNSIISMNREIEFHHGDCVGADEMADLHVRYLMDNSFPIKIHIHPPINDFARAHCERRQWETVIHEPKKFLIRNGDIAFVCDLLIVTPKEKYEMRRSGTWSTVRRARRHGKQIRIILPDGTVKDD